MKEYPILFKGEMVRAIRNTKRRVWPVEPMDWGRPFKWQTRRIMKPQPDGRLYDPSPNEKGLWEFSGEVEPEEVAQAEWRYPYGQLSDLLWVKETWGGLFNNLGVYLHWHDTRREFRTKGRCVGAFYQATDDNDDYNGHYAPSIFMPRWASRETLLQKKIRVEPVKNIQWRDVFAEGVGVAREPRDWADETLLSIHLRMQFSELWNEINGRPKPAKRNPYTNAPEECYVSYPWDDVCEVEAYRGRAHYVVGNPMVWVISFMRM